MSTTYKGLSVITPTGDGGQLLINDLMALADRAGPVWSAAADPTDPTVIATLTTQLNTVTAILYPPSTVSGLTPISGVNGTSVTISGTYLSLVTSVTFGGVAAQVTSQSDSQIVVNAPAGATSISGVADVVLVSPNGNVTMVGAYTYTNP